MNRGIAHDFQIGFSEVGYKFKSISILNFQKFKCSSKILISDNTFFESFGETMEI